MTTIAWDGVTLAADTALLSETKKVPFLGKIKKVKTGLLAFCGNVEDGLVLMKWFTDGSDWDTETGLTSESNTDLLHIAKNGDLTLYGYCGIPLPVTKGLFSMGSGGHLALGYMAAGGSAVDAVTFAIKHDPNSGFDAMFLKL